MILKEFVNWKLTHSDKVTSAEGYPLLMGNCKTNKKMKQLEVYGNSIQNNTPSIENPIEVESVGELCTKNLLSNVVYVNQTAQHSSVIRGVCELKEGITYTVSFDTPNTNNMIYFTSYEYVNEGLKQIVLNGERHSITVTPTKDLSINGAIMSATNTVNTFGETGLCSNCMIEEGSTATEYEPYGKYKIPVVVRGENFIPYSAVLANNYSEYRVLGTSYTIRGNVGKSALSNDAGQLMFPSLSTISTNGIDVTKGKTYTLSFDYLLREQGVYNDRMALYVYGTSNAIRYQNLYIYGTIGETVSYNLSFTSEYDEKIVVCFRINNNYVTLSNIRMEDADIEPVTQNVFINEPLGLDRYIDFKNKKVYNLDGSEEVIECSLPKLIAKTSVIEVDTSIAPSNMRGKYIKK